MKLVTISNLKQFLIRLVCAELLAAFLTIFLPFNFLNEATRAAIHPVYSSLEPLFFCAFAGEVLMLMLITWPLLTFIQWLYDTPLRKKLLEWLKVKK